MTEYPESITEGGTRERAAEMGVDALLLDLAFHLAHHAEVGYRECRGLEVEEAEGDYSKLLPRTDGRTDGLDVEFEVTLLGRRISVTLEMAEA